MHPPSTGTRCMSTCLNPRVAHPNLPPVSAPACPAYTRSACPQLDDDARGFVILCLVYVHLRSGVWGAPTCCTYSSLPRPASRLLARLKNTHLQTRSSSHGFSPSLLACGLAAESSVGLASSRPDMRRLRPRNHSVRPFGHDRSLRCESPSVQVRWFASAG